VKALTNRIVLFAVFGTVSFYLGHFSVRQSLVLSFFLALIVPSIPDRNESKEFTPFWLRVVPNYAAILVDCGVLSTESEWHEMVMRVREQIDSNASEPDSAYTKALLYGFYCYVLSHDRESENFAVAWPKTHSYSSQIKYSVEVDCITMNSFGAHPRVTLKPATDGYQLCLEVGIDWFEKGWLERIQSKLNLGKSESVDYLTGRIELPLAKLPYEEFQLHYWNSGTLEKRNAALAKFGWKETDIDWESHHPGAPVDLSHRYASIAHRDM
jgi:hypothetical protein